jgi:ubiquinone/menaquinone biosynthesis C-methylase UbiE
MNDFTSTREFLDEARRYPGFLMDQLKLVGIGLPGQLVLDLGTGTGSFARLLARQNCSVTGIDANDALIEKAREIANREGLTVNYQCGLAESNGMETASYDVVTAAQCWHWFPSLTVASEVRRVLRPMGHIAIVHFDPVPIPGNLFETTERILDQFHSDLKPWRTLGGSVGIYRDWLRDLQVAGFENIRSMSMDHDVSYERNQWEDRLRGSVIAAQLSSEKFASFLASLQAGTADLTWPQVIPHRCFWVTANSPSSDHTT